MKYKNLTLAIDTSSYQGSIALFDENKTISVLNIESKNTHSNTILKRIDFLLEETGINLNQLKNILAVNGPGSFTGIRIGISVIKAFAYALNLKVYNISTLQLLSFENDENSISFIHTFLPGIRDELYYGKYKLDKIPIKIEEKLIYQSQIEKLDYNDSVIIIPDYLNLFKNLINKIKIKKITYNNIFKIFLKPELFLTDINKLTPYYLRESEAEIKHRQNKKTKYQLYIENLMQ